MNTLTAQSTKFGNFVLLRCRPVGGPVSREPFGGAGEPWYLGTRFYRYFVFIWSKSCQQGYIPPPLQNQLKINDEDRSVFE